MSQAGRVARVGAQAVTRQVTPVKSQNKEQARANVLQAYKELQRIAPTVWWDYGLYDMPLGVFRAVLKKQFTKNAHLQDVRVIDRRVAELKQDIVAVQYAFYNPDHVRNMLFRENVEPKPKDFLSKFLNSKE